MYQFMLVNVQISNVKSMNCYDLELYASNQMLIVKCEMKFYDYMNSTDGYL